MTQEDHVELVKTHTFLRKHATGKAKIELHVLQVERGKKVFYKDMTIRACLYATTIFLTIRLGLILKYFRNELGSGS